MVDSDPEREMRQPCIYSQGTLLTKQRLYDVFAELNRSLLEETYTL